MTRFYKIASGLLAAAVLAFSSPVLAASEGQIETGNIYRIKNITKQTSFVDPANADACNVLMYRVEIHNPGPSGLTNVNVKATLPSAGANSHVSTATISAVNADPTSVTDTATLNLSSVQNISYVSGSTQLLDHNGNATQTLADGITQGGISIGNVGVSIGEQRYVQFQVKVNCPETPKPVPTPTPKPPVTQLPNTGAGSIVGLFAGVSATAGTLHYIVSRRLGRDS